MHCIPAIYSRLLPSVTMSKEDLEEIAFDLELDRQLTENNDWKRLENGILEERIFHS